MLYILCWIAGNSWKQEHLVSSRLSWKLCFGLLVVLQYVPFMSVAPCETLENNCYLPEGHKSFNHYPTLLSYSRTKTQTMRFYPVRVHCSLMWLRLLKGTRRKKKVKTCNSFLCSSLWARKLIFELWCQLCGRWEKQIAGISCGKEIFQAKL